MAVIWQVAAVLTALITHAPERIECFADRPMIFQYGLLTQAAEQAGTTVVTYRVDERELIETRLSVGLGRDQERAAAIVQQRLDQHPEWLEQLTHSALGQSRALALDIRRYPAIAIGDRVYYTDHIDQALQQDVGVQDAR